MKKYPSVAPILSFILPGLGQIYNGQILRGLLLMVAYSMSYVLCIILIGYPLVLGLWIFSVWDAYKVAKDKNVLKEWS